MRKLITLLRLRQEGFQTEIYDDDFIINIPENLVDGTTLCTNNIAKSNYEKLHAQPSLVQTVRKLSEILAMTTTGVILFCMPRKKSSKLSEYHA